MDSSRDICLLELKIYVFFACCVAPKDSSRLPFIELAHEKTFWNIGIRVTWFESPFHGSRCFASRDICYIESIYQELNGEKACKLPNVWSILKMLLEEWTMIVVTSLDCCNMLSDPFWNQLQSIQYNWWSAPQTLRDLRCITYQVLSTKLWPHDLKWRPHCKIISHQRICVMRKSPVLTQSNLKPSNLLLRAMPRYQ